MNLAGITRTLVTALLLVLITSPGEAHLPHDNIKAVAVSPAYPADRTVFASLSHTFPFLLKSTDAGVSWTPSQTGIPYSTVSSIAVSPALPNDGVLFVGTNRPLPNEEGLVLRSDDTGASWQLAAKGLPGSKILVVEISPGFPSDQTVFAGTAGDGVFVSNDAGETWTSLHPGAAGLDVFEIAVSTSFATDRTFAIGTNAGLQLSTDAGETFSNPIPQGEIRGVALSPDFAQDSTVYVTITGFGVFYSEDSGATWLPKNNGITEFALTSVAISPNYAVDQTVLASTDNRVFRTTNNGDLWTYQNQGLEPPNAQASSHYIEFAFSPAYEFDNTIFFATFDGLVRSINGASSWRRMSSFSHQLMRGLGISPAYSADGTVFAGAYGGGAYRSEDGGDNWEAIDTGLSNMFIHPIVVSPDFAADDTVFLGHSQSLLRSSSRGDNWTRLDVNDPDGIVFSRKLAISPDYVVDRTLFLADDLMGANKLYRSTDGGESFVPLSPPVQVARSLALSSGYAADQTIFVGTGFVSAGSGLYRSRNGGDAWQRMLDGPGVLSVAVSPGFVSDGVAFAGTLADGVFKSSDGGDTWVKVNNGFPEIIAIESLSVSPQFATDGTVFAGSRTRGVYRSVDSGLNWTAVGMAGDHIPTLAVSPNYGVDQTVFAGGWTGLHRTTDGGASWHRALNLKRYDDRSDFVLYHRNWNKVQTSPASSGGISVAARAQAQATLVFLGDSVSVIGTRTPAGGIAYVSIDGGPPDNIDFYAPGVLWQEVVYSSSRLGPGEHWISIKVSGQQNSNSTGTLVYIDAFDISY